MEGLLIGLLVGIAITIWQMFAAAVEQGYNNKLIAAEELREEAKRALNAAKEAQNDNNL